MRLRWEVAWDLVTVCFLRSGDLGRKHEYYSCLFLASKISCYRTEGYLGFVGQGLGNLVVVVNPSGCGPRGLGCGAREGVQPGARKASFAKVVCKLDLRFVEPSFR